MNEEIKIPQKNNTDKLILAISIFLYICSLVPFAEWFILGGTILSLIILFVTIILQKREATKMKLLSIVCLSVVLVTNIVFYLSILTIF